MQDRIEEVDLWKVRALDNQLTLDKERAQRSMTELQAHLDTMWKKYDLRKDIDQIQPDGTIVRAPKAEEAK
jgi:hypothetical protein